MCLIWICFISQTHSMHMVCTSSSSLLSLFGIFIFYFIVYAKNSAHHFIIIIIYAVHIYMLIVDVMCKTLSFTLFFFCVHMLLCMCFSFNDTIQFARTRCVYVCVRVLVVSCILDWFHKWHEFLEKWNGNKNRNVALLISIIAVYVGDFFEN